MALVMRYQMTDILQDGTLRNYYVSGKIQGFQFDVRLGYYRGHYLSTIDELAVEIDNMVIPSQCITFCVNGKEFCPAELKYQVSEFWTILQPATIKIIYPGGLAEGEHLVNLTLILRSPYMPLPGATEPHSYTPIDSCDKKTMTLSTKMG